MTKDQDNLIKEIEKTGLIKHKPPAKASVVKLKTNDETAAPFNTWSLADAKFNPNKKYILKGLINPSTLGVFSGEWGSGKSFVVLDLLFHIALGLKWHGKRVTQSKVLYLALEGLGGIEERAEAIKRHYKEQGVIDDKTDLSNFRISSPASFYLSHDNKMHRPDIDSLIATIKNEDIKFVVIDTLAHALGGSDENMQGMLTAIRSATEIINQTGASISVIHHPPKSNPKELRGHSSLIGASDVHITITKEEADNGKRVIHLASNKVKDGRDDHIMMATLKEIPLGTDIDGDPINSCVAVPFDGELTKNKPKGLTGRTLLLHKLLPGIFLEMEKQGKITHKIIGGHRCKAILKLDAQRWLVQDGYLESTNVTSVTSDETCNLEEKHLNITGKDKTAFSRSLDTLHILGKWGKDRNYIWQTYTDIPEAEGNWEDGTAPF
jgi:hypothetical protein